jgi:hypothetical protein
MPRKDGGALMKNAPSALLPMARRCLNRKFFFSRQKDSAG